ncbi:MAG: hypothetical protein ACI8ZM_003775 [Crocinitomix sp.]|jgi:hypothetical protein
MKILFTLFSICLFLSPFCQNELDTIVFDNYGDLAFLQGKAMPQVEIGNSNNSLSYFGQNRTIKSNRNYILIKNNQGVLRFEGKYFKQYRDGIYIAYDQMGRKICEGQYKYVRAKTKRYLRKTVSTSEGSKQVGKWMYYTYANDSDTNGINSGTQNFGR